MITHSPFPVLVPSGRLVHSWRWPPRACPWRTVSGSEHPPTPTSPPQKTRPPRGRCSWGSGHSRGCTLSTEHVSDYKHPVPYRYHKPTCIRGFIYFAYLSRVIFTLCYFRPFTLLHYFPPSKFHPDRLYFYSISLKQKDLPCSLKLAHW